MISGVAVAGGTVAGLAALAGATAYATLNAQSQIFGPMLVTPPRPEQIALTFDDGPNPSATPQLLEVLARRGVRATFFLIGEYARREPALTREIAAAGHVVGNHTMSHPWLARYSGAFIRQQIGDCNRVLEDVLGSPVELFRPPHGARRPVVLRAARELGLTTVGWNLIVGDWKDVGPESIERKLQRGIARNRRAGRGTNLVLHDGGQHEVSANRLATVAAVGHLLDRIDAEFVRPPGWI